MKAISLIEEVEVTEELLERVRTGEGLTVEDQIWVLMQAVSRFTDVLDAIPADDKHIIDAERVVDAVSMILLASRADERPSLSAYVSGDTDVIEELDGPAEDKSLEEV